MQSSARSQDILAAHSANSLQGNRITSAKDLMQRVMYQVPLSRLYSIVASCQFDENARFCPILVKINDETIRKNNGGRSFLLQVWNLQGEMAFEKPLEKPVSNWNISNDVLLYLEDISSTEVWMVKLFEDKSPILYKFLIPSLNKEKAINSFYDHSIQNFVIPSEA